MIHSRALPVLLSVVALILGACAANPADESDAAEESPPPPAVESPTPEDTDSPTDFPEIVETPAAPASEAAAGSGAITTGDTEEYGAVLTDGDGMTLYVFLQDVDGESTCDDTCAETWPPVVAEGDLGAEGDVDESLLGTTQRDDGTEQVTYDGQPLYLYQADSAPGDVNGFGVGDVWYPVAPDGSAIDVATGVESTDDGY